MEVEMGRRRQEAKLDAQRKERATKAKYGQTKKPAPVIVKYMDGTSSRIVDQAQITGQPRPKKKKRSQPNRKRNKHMDRIDRISAALDHELSDALAKDSM